MCSSRGRAPMGALLPALLLAAACGIKGPPSPPLPKAPEPVRGVELRQSGADVEVSWIEPARRQDGGAIDGPLSYEVRAAALERPSPPSASGTAAGAIPAAPPGSSRPPEQARPSSVSPAPVRLSFRARPDDLERREEDAFLRRSTVVATVKGRWLAEGQKVGANTQSEPVLPPAERESKTKDASGRQAQSPAERSEQPGETPATEPRQNMKRRRKTERSASAKNATPGRADTGRRRESESLLLIALGPERFAGTRLASSRLELAVVALDANGRQSPPRPILALDPVEPLPPLESFDAVPVPEGVRLRWKVPPLGDRASLSRVNLYRVSEGAGAREALVRGSPFAGSSALDESVRIAENYRYEARLVDAGPGSGRREGPAAGPVAVSYLDRFAPGPPALVTIDALPPAPDHPGAWAVRLAWSSPIDVDVAGYRVYRAEGEGDFALAASLPSNETTWLDASVTPGGRVRYSLTAIDTASPPNESARSEIMETVPGPSEPAGGAK